MISKYKVEYIEWCSPNEGIFRHQYVFASSRNCVYVYV